MKKDKKINVCNIRCSNIDCDYAVEGVYGDEYSNWINKSCPDCGNILLTEDDYNDAKYLTKIAELANSVLKKKDDISMNIAINDNGKVDFRIERF